MSKAALYVRVSTVMQLDKESRGVQKNDLIRYCEDILGILDYEIFENAGFSAGSTDRPDYQEMLRRIRSSEFTHLLVWKIDRVSRNIIDFTEMYQELQTLNVTFISLAEQFDTSSIVGQALLKMILIFAELRDTTPLKDQKLFCYQRQKPESILASVSPLDIVGTQKQKNILLKKQKLISFVRSLICLTRESRSTK